jgi:diadenosine tetraphosphate (Ap4A) HIT family hydrolase
MPLQDKPGQCLFCREQKIVLENELAYVTRDSYPVTQGHTLVIPRRHVPSLFNLTTEERLAMFELLDGAKRELDGRYQPDGYNIGINDGAAAGQSIMHLHIHVMPRYKGDKADPRGGVRWILPEKAAYWLKK